MIKLCLVATIPATVKVFFGDQLLFLQEHGYQITVITSPEGGCQNIEKSLPDGITVEYISISRTIKPLEDLKALWKITRIIRDNHFDIVQYVTPKGALFGSIASWMAKVPVRLYLMWGLYYVTQTGFRRFVYKTIERLICGCSTAIAPDSKGNVALAVEEGLCNADKISIVGHGSANGVDTTRFDPDRLAQTRKEIRKDCHIPDSAIVFGCIAAIVGDKGINELIESFERVSQDNPHAYLLYIGQTTEKDPVKPSTLELMKANPRIIHLGWQTEPEKYLAAMDIFVLPTYREGFGVVNIEASAMALPVISTDVPGPQESIVHGETGILVPARSVEPLANAMKDLMGRPSYLQKLGRAGRKRVQDFYEQKKLWQAILEHKQSLLHKAGSASRRRTKPEVM
jgi:glycosyltransferase involved in cell wall biosynthesis